MTDMLERIDWSRWDSKEDNFAKYKHIRTKLIYGKLPEGKIDVSIMIPTFRRADLLKDAIESALAQKTKYSFTITVVDNDADIDQATDNLLRQYCLQHKNILYYRNEKNIGMFGNWNRCIELSQSEWLCLLHDDDLLMENYIETLYPIAQSNMYGIVGSSMKYLDQIENIKVSATGRNFLMSIFIRIIIWARHGKEIPLTLKDGVHSIFQKSVGNLINKDSAIGIGGFDDIFSPCSDVFFWEKMKKYYGVAFVPNQLYCYRIIRNESLNMSTSWNVLSMTPSLPRAIQESFGLPERDCQHSFIESFIIVYNVYPFIKEKIKILDAAEKLKIPKRYCNKWAQFWIVTKYNFRMGMLLFRKRKCKG